MLFGRKSFSGQEVPSNRTFLLEKRLDTWKEIAAYLKRDVRTVQRWEKEQGLPVHRHLHHQGATVYAFKRELDLWWAGEAGQVPSVNKSWWLKFCLVSAVVVAVILLGSLPLNLGLDATAPSLASSSGDQEPVYAGRYIHIVESANQTGESLFDGSLEHALKHRVEGCLPVFSMPRGQFELWLSGSLARAYSEIQGRPPFLVLDARILTTSRSKGAGEDGPYTLQVDVIQPSTGSVVATLREHASDGNQVLPAALRISEIAGDFLESTFLSEPDVCAH